MFRQRFLILIYLFVILELCKVSSPITANKPRFKYKLIRIPFIDSELLEECPGASKAPYYLSLDIFGKKYVLSLYQGKSVFTPDAQIIVHRGGHELEDITINVKDIKNELIDGVVVDHPNSYVRGYLEEGIFNGVIYVNEEHFFVESAKKFVNESEKYDVVIYSGNDVEMWPQFFGKNAKGQPSKGRNHSSKATFKNSNVCDMQDYLIFEDSVKPVLDGDRSVPEGARKGPKVCHLNLVGDHWFLHEMHHNNIHNAFKSMDFHVREADKLFRVADFDGNGSPDSIQLKALSAHIYQSAKDRNYYLSDPSMDAVNYLEKFSYYDHNRFCGAMAFSYRDFPDDVLGYAYRGGPGKSGGICFKRQVYNGKERSLNVGLMSFNSPWGTLKLAQSVIVLTHELGHMFGSAHDEEADGGACFVPGRSDQHFIMSSVANPGTSKINKQFSICSRKMIYNNIKVNGGCLSAASVIHKARAINQCLYWGLALQYVIYSLGKKFD